SGSLHWGSRRRARSQGACRTASVCESPLANNVTSCPCRTSSSVKYDTTRSVPPYSCGGQLSCSGTTCAILISPHPQAVSQVQTDRIFGKFQRLTARRSIIAGERAAWEIDIPHSHTSIEQPGHKAC